MLGKLKAWLDDFKGSLARLSSRERMMFGGLAAAFVFGAVFVVGYIVFSGLERLEERNAAIRQALVDLSDNRKCYMEHRQRIAQVESRISRAPVELNRFVETAASAVGVSIAESSEVNPVDIERYTQRGVEIKLRKISLGQLTQLLKELENSPHIVQITRLNVATRWNEHDALDVELVVSTFEQRKKPAGGEDPKRARSKRGRS